MDKAFDEIEQLLKDIAEYLEKKSKNVELSSEEQEYASKLIERSKKQLQKIDEIKSVRNEYYVIDGQGKTEKESYVSMYPPGQRHPELVNEVTYSPPPLPKKSANLLKNKTPSPEPMSPYKDLPAKQASTEIKYGPLITQRKILKIVFNQKMFGVIHVNWLLIYVSEKDSKPLYTLDLRYYKASAEETGANVHEGDENVKSEDGKHYGKTTSTFRVVHIDLQSKKYEFVAKTEKDMRQWIAIINHRHDQAVRAENGIDEEIYEISGEVVPLSKIEETPHFTKGYERPMQSKPLPSIPAMEIDDKPLLPKRKVSPIPTESTEDIYQELGPHAGSTSADDGREPLLMASSDSFDSIDEPGIYDELEAACDSQEKYSPEPVNDDCEQPEQYYEDVARMQENVQGFMSETNPISPPKSVNDFCEKSDQHYEDVASFPDNVKDFKVETNCPIKETSVNNDTGDLRELNKGKFTNITEQIRKPPLKPKLASKPPINSSTKPKVPAKPSSIINKHSLNEQKLKFSKLDSIPKNPSQPCSFETFSRNSKTFQAGLSKTKCHIETVRPNYDNILKEIHLLQTHKSEDNEQPMVLLKSEKDKRSSIKTPIVSNKPKKPVARKLAF